MNPGRRSVSQPLEPWMRESNFVLLFGAALAAHWIAINHVVPEPYMDEIFHVNQAQHYCAGDWSYWDPKLTTPPGLYLGPAALSLVFKTFGFTSIEICSTAGLRALNAVLALALLLATESLIAHFQSSYELKNKTRSTVSVSPTLRAFALCLFPVSFFFSGLYYTDTGSMTFVVLSYLSSVRGNHVASAAFSFVATLFRQTNIVWAIFVGAASVVEAFERQRVSRGLMQDIADFASFVVGHPWTVVQRAGPHIAVVASVALYYLQNDGVALGDKDHHQLSLHFPQILYFALFLFGFSIFTLQLKELLWAPRARSNLLAFFIPACVVATIFVYFFTIEHPFILSDNRHYTFYIWRRWFRKGIVYRLALVPLYSVSIFTTFLTFARSTSPIPALGFAAAVTLTLVPSPLLEFRYFLIPFHIFHIHNHRASLRQHVLQLALFLAVGAVTDALFLTRTFTWPSEPDARQRFMW
ncbi:glycosyltransferase family 59 protein [Gonapodya prolifera JEL478]|uniref:Dol-P-Glc:Glc(2)Man(9)GlcNAc(2)-PP-Dol alpha-1,2-glucosyltransferase n=1 Tax=Gonapodya prolifera (strain JEL478) TaxID=1344416 RepID=A0A139A5W8_GONPJ|nr:glycosyltransferase family 59 protein [Gonapodya prolifera JEL478]|eukprot:KXS11763.1 glycosyltransferase family 59 protein [Gonapodya prolifera JEL478]